MSNTNENQLLLCGFRFQRPGVRIPPGGPKVERSRRPYSSRLLSYYVVLFLPSWIGRGWFEKLFSSIFERKVLVGIIHTILDGFEECVFEIDNP